MTTNNVMKIFFFLLFSILLEMIIFPVSNKNYFMIIYSLLHKVVISFFFLYNREAENHRTKENTSNSYGHTDTGQSTLLRNPLRMEAAFTESDRGILIVFSKMTEKKKKKI